MLPERLSGQRSCQREQESFGAAICFVWRVSAIVARRADESEFRNSWEKPEPLVPGRISQLNFTMPDVDSHLPQRTPHHGARFKVHGFPR